MIAFLKLWVHSFEVDKYIFSWEKVEFAGHLVQLDVNGTSVNMLKEVTGLESPTGSILVKMVKKGSMKRVIERRLLSGKRVKTVMRMEHVSMMLRKLYKRQHIRWR